jgi:hypothetical protein
LRARATSLTHGSVRGIALSVSRKNRWLRALAENTFTVPILIGLPAIAKGAEVVSRPVAARDLLPGMLEGFVRRFDCK